MLLGLPLTSRPGQVECLQHAIAAPPHSQGRSKCRQQTLVHSQAVATPVVGNVETEDVCVYNKNAPRPALPLCCSAASVAGRSGEQIRNACSGTSCAW